MLMMGIDEEFIENAYQKGVKYQEFMSKEDDIMKKEFALNWENWIIK